MLITKLERVDMTATAVPSQVLRGSLLQPIAMPDGVRSQADSAAHVLPEVPTAIAIRRLNFFYGETHTLHDISLDIPRHQVTAFIGPSGCGKSTLLRCLNRLNDLVEGARHEGRIMIEASDIYDPDLDLIALRKSVGMVFQKTNPFPKTIFENVAYGPRIAGLRDRAELEGIVERSLRGAALWEEVKDRLHQSALGLSGGQQQRLCIARAIAVQPKIILMDEPCSALDVEGTRAIEELMFNLKGEFTILIVTHNMAQARRVGDESTFMLLGEVVEHLPTEDLFSNPRHPKTIEYIEGRLG